MSSEPSLHVISVCTVGLAVILQNTVSHTDQQTEVITNQQHTIKLSTEQ